MDLTWDNIPTILSVVTGVGGMVLAALLYRARAEFASRGAVDTLGARVDAVETRQAALAAQLEQIPTHSDLAALRTELAGVRGDVKALSATVNTGLGSVREQLSMMVRHHLQRTP